MYNRYILGALSLVCRAVATTHGEGDEGTIMGPVAFLWPDDRVWDATYDNTAPCGSSAGITNRTKFPLNQGEVALSIADDAYQVAFYISLDNNPTEQSDFTEQIVRNVTEIEPGHQCYKIGTIPSGVAAGSNATIQLEYWADYEGENNSKNQTFYACADIYFVEAADFDVSVPCFNVTAGTFDSTVTATASSAASTASDAASTSSSSSSNGLSKGAIAGIAVGTIVGSLSIVAAAAYILLRKRKTAAGQDRGVGEMAAKGNAETGSLASTH